MVFWSVWMVRQVPGRRWCYLPLSLTGKPWQTSSLGVSSYSGHHEGVSSSWSSSAYCVHFYSCHHKHCLHTNFTLPPPHRQKHQKHQKHHHFVTNWLQFRGGGFALAAGSDRSGLSKWIGEITLFYQSIFSYASSSTPHPRQWVSQ